MANLVSKIQPLPICALVKLERVLISGRSCIIDAVYDLRDVAIVYIDIACTALAAMMRNIRKRHSSIEQNTKQKIQVLQMLFKHTFSHAELCLHPNLEGWVAA